MSEICYNLESGQYLSSLELEIDRDVTTLLIAPTGVGKTTFTMEDLSKQYKTILMIVPTQAKVQELQNAYSESKHGQKYKFFYADYSPNNSLEKFKGVIVATYDKFEKIRELLPKNKLEDTLLVIDECHKLYSSGSFRDEALMPIIKVMHDKSFPSILLLTATFTPELFSQLEVEINHTVHVKQSNPISRQIELRYLSKGDQYTYIQFIIDRLTAVKKDKADNRKKTIIVRLNSREKCEKSALFFETQYKCKCLVVHSKNKDDIQVDKMFKQQKISNVIDIVFTTSIMDEAVNLNNDEVELDSMILVGKQAHPEEVVQFLGRLRQASIPCFILMHTPIKRGKESVQKMHEKHLRSLENYLSRVSQVAELTSGLIDDISISFDEDIKKMNIYEKIKRLNETFKDLFDCKLFIVCDGKAQRNYASLVANSYRRDSAKCYQEFKYLKWRIKQLLPSCNVRDFEDASTVTSSQIELFFHEQQELSDKAYQECIEDALYIFLRSSNDPTFEDIKDRAEDLIKKVKDDEDFLLNRAYKYKVKHAKETANVLAHIIRLACHISNISDIKSILQKKEYERVIAVGNAYASNLFVIEMTKKIVSSHKKNLGGTHKITPSRAQSLLIQSIKSVQKNSHIPMKTIIKQKLIQGLQYDYERGDINVTETKALNYIAKYFYVEDKNRKQAAKRYLNVLGVGVGGYDYVSLSKYSLLDEATVATIHIKGCEYDNYTGSVIVNSEKNERKQKKMLTALYEDLDPVA